MRSLNLDKFSLKALACWLVCFMAGVIIGSFVTAKKMMVNFGEQQKEITVRIQDIDQERLKIEELLQVLDSTKKHFERVTVILEASSRQGE